jgi:hypothetical protein
MAFNTIGIVFSVMIGFKNMTYFTISKCGFSYKNMYYYFNNFALGAFMVRIPR